MNLLLSISSALDRYLVMFNKYPGQHNTNRIYVEKKLKEFIPILKKQDRITWMCKVLRILMIKVAIKYKHKATSKEELEEYLVKDFGPGQHKWLTEISTNRMETLISDVQHYLSLNIPEINNTVFTKQDPEELLDKFSRVEEEWKKKQGSKVKETGTKVLEFPDGSAWFDLGKEYCDVEGKAMGHCGNQGNYRPGDRVLSYRTPNKDGTWTPNLTFILDKDGFLGEMKGRGNDKPSTKYHKQIISLLESSLVKGIKGGGYLPENNFSILDLDGDMLLDILPKKPYLITMGECVELQATSKNEKLVKMAVELQNKLIEGANEHQLLEYVDENPLIIKILPKEKLSERLLNIGFNALSITNSIQNGYIFDEEGLSVLSYVLDNNIRIPKDSTSYVIEYGYPVYFKWWIKVTKASNIIFSKIITALAEADRSNELYESLEKILLTFPKEWFTQKVLNEINYLNPREFNTKKLDNYLATFLTQDQLDKFIVNRYYLLPIYLKRFKKIDQKLLESITSAAPEVIGGLIKYKLLTPGLLELIFKARLRDWTFLSKYKQQFKKLPQNIIDQTYDYYKSNKKIISNLTGIKLFPSEKTFLQLVEHAVILETEQNIIEQFIQAGYPFNANLIHKLLYLRDASEVNFEVFKVLMYNNLLITKRDIDTCITQQLNDEQYYNLSDYVHTLKWGDNKYSASIPVLVKLFSDYPEFLKQYKENDETLPSKLVAGLHKEWDKYDTVRVLDRELDKEYIEGLKELVKRGKEIDINLEGVMLTSNLKKSKLTRSLKTAAEIHDELSYKVGKTIWCARLD